MRTAPKVSVILPAYNVAAYIDDALKSVFAQTVQDMEVIVVNDGSPDTPDFERAIEPYRHRITYLVQQNMGLAGARNTGIRAARGEFIALLDSDDIWEPDCLALQLECAAENPKASVVYSNATFFGGSHLDGKLYTDLFPSNGPVTIESVCQGRCNIFGAALLRRDAIASVDHYDLTLRDGCEDLDLYLRMLLRGHVIVYHAQPVYRYRRRPGQLSVNERKLSSALVLVLKRLAMSSSVSQADRISLMARAKWAQSRIDLIDGKAAMAAGEVALAREKLSQANSTIRSVKIATTLLASYIAPRWTQDMVLKHGDFSGDPSIVVNRTAKS